MHPAAATLLIGFGALVLGALFFPDLPHPVHIGFLSGLREVFLAISLYF